MLFVAYCLHRFGVLLAANDAAGRAWLYRPRADAYEQGLARQLARLVNFVEATVPKSN